MLVLPFLFVYLWTYVCICLYFDVLLNAFIFCICFFLQVFDVFSAIETQYCYAQK